MIKKMIFLVLLNISLCIDAQDNISALIPMPNHIECRTGDVLQLDKANTSYHIKGKGLEFAEERLRHIFMQRMDINIQPSKKNTEAAITLALNRKIKGDEHYRISCGKDGLSIEGATPAAILYGLATLDQILTGDVCATKNRQIAAIAIDDSPRFEHRALMLDPARHFIPVQDIKFYMDQMMKYKFNVLQLHLTDDQGWRLAVESHPKLASKQHYTHSDIEELIAYAKERNIEIIPEIDIPGHTVAILAAYPELACAHKKDAEKTVGKSVNMMLCAANDDVYRVMEDVIHEVADIFTSDYIHLGGDESAIAENWAKCKRCQAMMKELDYGEASQLMTPFFGKILEYVGDCGKKAILWCELNNIYPPADDYLFPYPKDVTLVSWRNGLTPTCLQLTHERGNDIILAPGEYAYFDYPQYKNDLPEYNNWGMPITTLEKAYGFDPGYGKTAEMQQHIKGVMGTLWGEAINDIHRANYMTYPRAFALAEAGWSKMEVRNWESFKQRIYPNIMELMKAGVSVRVPFEIAE